MGIEKELTVDQVKILNRVVDTYHHITADLALMRGTPGLSSFSLGLSGARGSTLIKQTYLNVNDPEHARELIDLIQGFAVRKLKEAGISVGFPIVGSSLCE